MKRTLFISLCGLLVSLSSMAQQPFKKYGYEVEISTLSKGKYIEDFTTDSLVQVGSVIMNRVTGKVVSFITYDTLYSEATLDPQLISRWMSPDPLAEEFYDWSPYNFAFNNPIRYNDHTGLAPFDIVGATKQDATQFRDDIHNILSDDKFSGVRDLIAVKGKKFVHIDNNALSAALDGVELSTDERAFVDIVTNTINSDDVHTIEFISGEFTSTKGAAAFRDHMNNAQAGVGDMMLTPEGKLSSGIIEAHGSGLNVPTKDGSHSFIGKGSNEVTSSHEVFGHGIPSAKGLSPKENNANAIRTDNLVRRILKLPQRDGRDHGGFKEGHITEPRKLPIIK